MAQKAFTRTIDLGDGSGKQVFEADTAEGLADALAEAQLNATKKIRELSGTNQELQRRVLAQPAGGEVDPDGPMPGFKPRELNANDLFALGQKLQNPATAVAALQEAIEAGLGASLEEVRRTLRLAQTTPRQLRGRQAAEEFLLRHPEFIPNAKNQETMFAYMEHPDRNMALTSRNFEIAFGELRSRGLLELRAPEPAANGNGKPAQGAEGDSPAPNGQPEVPRFASTTSVVTRGTGTPRGASASKMPTAEEIDKMSASEHRTWMRVPGFMEHENRVLEAQKSRR